MGRYFEGMRILSIFLFLVFLCACAHFQRNSVIVQKFVAAGGGDPEVAHDWQIQAWFAKHQDVRKEFEQPCAPLLTNPPSSEWSTTAEGKICFAQGRAKQVEFKSDGSKF